MERATQDLACLPRCYRARRVGFGLKLTTSHLLVVCGGPVPGGLRRRSKMGTGVGLTELCFGRMSAPQVLFDATEPGVVVPGTPGF